MTNEELKKYFGRYTDRTDGESDIVKLLVEIASRLPENKVFTKVTDSYVCGHVWAPSVGRNPMLNKFTCTLCGFEVHR